MAPDTSSTRIVAASHAPPPPTSLPQAPPKTTRGFEGHILDNKYALFHLVKEDLARQERLYHVHVLCSCATTAAASPESSSPCTCTCTYSSNSTDTSDDTDETTPMVFAKEYCLTDIPPKLKKSRRRNLQNFANKQNVISCVDYGGKKFLVFDTTPTKEMVKAKDKKGKGKEKALDSDFDQDGDDDDEDENHYSGATGRSDPEERPGGGGMDPGLKAQITGSGQTIQVHGDNMKPASSQTRLADTPLPHNGGNLNNAKAQTRRPRRGRGRTKPCESATGALEGHHLQEERQPSSPHSDVDWDSMDEDLDDHLQMALEVTTKEAFERYLLDLALATSISIGAGEE